MLTDGLVEFLLKIVTYLCKFLWNTGLLIPIAICWAYSYFFPEKIEETGAILDMAVTVEEVPRVVLLALLHNPVILFAIFLGLYFMIRNILRYLFSDKSIGIVRFISRRFGWYK